MKDALIQLLTAFIASLGFSMLFGMRRRYLFVGSLGGLLAWGVYLLVDYGLHNDFLSCLAASAFAVLYAEFLARRMKTPATLFVVPAILPLVPGASLYYMMDAIVHGQLEAAKAFGRSTLVAALAIAAGISVITALRELHRKRR